MRKLWIRSLALSLGLVATGARGQEVWRAPQAAPAVSLGKPRAIASSRPADAPPAATLLRPVAAARPDRRDGDVQQVAFTPGRDPGKPVARGIAPEGARPMPPAPAADGLPPAGMHTWQRSDGVVATTVSRNGPDASATSAAPPPPRTGPESLLVPPTPAPALPPGAAAAPIIPPPATTAPQPTLVPTPADAGGPPVPGLVSGAPLIANAGPCCPAPTCCPAPACGPAGCGPWGGGGDGDFQRWLIGAEFLLWWVKGDNTPQLVKAAGPGNQYPGVELGNPNGRVLYGAERKSDNVRPGGRLFGAYWLNECWAIDASGFYLGNSDNSNFTSSVVGTEGTSVSVGRPFQNTTPGAAQIGDAQEVAGPFLNGFVNITRQSNLWGADTNIRRNVWCSDLCCGSLRVDGLVGGRILGIDENIDIVEYLTVRVPQNDPVLGQQQVGDRFVVQDRFATQNRFYGGQVGLDGEYRRGPISLGFRGKIGLGVTEQLVQINGNTTFRNAPVLNVEGQPGGLLANGSTNAGSYSRKFFGVVPEVGLTLGYDVFDWWRVTAGYNFLYWNSVARPGEQISLKVNQNFAPGSRVPVTATEPRDPARTFNASDLYVHGLTFGMEFRY
jgi:hypothetical protein